MNLREKLVPIVDDIIDMLESKNHDYGDNNLTEYGQAGIVIRCRDKLSKLKNIGDTNGKVGENAEQEWGDIAGYAIQAVRLIREGRI